MGAPAAEEVGQEQTAVPCSLTPLGGSEVAGRGELIPYME